MWNPHVSQIRQIAFPGSYVPREFAIYGGPDGGRQPVEARSMVSACLEAERATCDAWWYVPAQRAFDWFLGWNDLGRELYAPTTGGCRDALHINRVNQNQRAESTGLPARIPLDGVAHG